MGCRLPAAVPQVANAFHVASIKRGTAVDSRQMVLHVIGKRNKERVLPLTESILDMLYQVWKIRRSPRWVCPSRRIVTHRTDDRCTMTPG